MYLVFKNIYNFLLNLIYNEKCLICGCVKTSDLLCKNCAKDVNYLSFFPQRFYKDVPVYSAVKYDNVVKKLIHLLKFNHKKSASVPLSGILYRYFKQLNLKNDFVIIYPPSFFLKSSSRGYNCMYLIAKEFSKLSGFPYLKNLIKKVKYTKPQYKVKNRFKNIKDGFQINQKYVNNIKNKTVLLIDDITTSGATLEELINCLKKKNINKIICLTIAKAG